MEPWDRFGGGFPPRKPPRPVKDGLKAKSRRGAIGDSWWSQRFIAVLERFGQGPRLARGRAYARRGQVIDLEVVPGLVAARVQGSRARPYRVAIRLVPLDDDDWRRAEEVIAGQAVFLARLLSGEMPEEIEEAFAACRLALFPAKRTDLTPECSCPDWEATCKHVAAVYYLLAERFDEDPFLILAWRGRPREQLLGELRALRGVTSPPSLDGDIVAGSSWADGLASDTPIDLLPDRFWGSMAGLAPPPPRPVPTASPDAILRELPASGLVARGRPIEQVLAPAYAAIVAATADLLRTIEDDRLEEG
jgi:uncharacterized Zn finger protein